MAKTTESTSKTTRWYEVKEKSSKIGLGYKMMMFLLKCFPAGFMRFLAYVIGFFYWLFSSRSRSFSKNYLNKIQACSADFGGRKPSTLRHFISFALNLVENIQSWAGKFSFKNVTWQNDDVLDLVKNINSGKGAVCVISHVGNAQMMRALASMNEAGTQRKMSITTVTDTKITGGFVKLMNQVNADSAFHVIPADSFGPDTILLLQDRLEKGEIVVIAGDRISAQTDRFIELPIFGQTAKFPYGVYLMIALLNAPTYFMYGLRHQDITLKPAYDMFVSKNPVDFDCPRKEREERIRQTAANFIEQTTKRTLEHPYQWYNFFDFWA